MNRPTRSMSALAASTMAILVTVELARRAGAARHDHHGLVELVDHVTARVFEDGTIIGTIRRRSQVQEGQVLSSQQLIPPASATLSQSEQHDVLHVAGLRNFPALVHEQTRWTVA